MKLTNTTMRKTITASVDPYPKFKDVKNVLYVYSTTVSVDLPGPPLVRTRGKSNMRTASMVRNSSATRIVGFSSGSVTLQKVCQRLAPSSAVASYNSTGINCKHASSSSA